MTSRPEFDTRLPVVLAESVPNMDRCCMGYPLGDDYRCTREALADGLWCATCQADIDGVGPRCECDGCMKEPLGSDDHRGASDGVG